MKNSAIRAALYACVAFIAAVRRDAVAAVAFASLTFEAIWCFIIETRIERAILKLRTRYDMNSQEALMSSLPHQRNQYALDRWRDAMSKMEAYDDAFHIVRNIKDPK